MSKGPTPAMKQFYEMKSRYPGCVLFFQMGDFYETFGEDAELISRELDITLTSRGKDKNGERMPLAGVPIHAGEAYVARMVKKGYRVAVCEQVEDPKKAKGVVKRDVVRVITPGTVIDSSMVPSEGQAYLMALVPDGKHTRFGLAFLDITTGEFFVTTCRADDGGNGLLSAVDRAGPRECLLPHSLSPRLQPLLEGRGIALTPCGAEYFDHVGAVSLLTHQFSVSTLQGFGCDDMDEAVAAAGACLRYATETQKCDLSHISSMQTRMPEQGMLLDAITMRNLELTRNIRDGRADHTLLSVLDRTKTPMGGRLLRTFITSPLTDAAEIGNRLDVVEYCLNEPLRREMIRDLLHRFADTERIAGRIAYGNAGPRDLLTLRDSLERLPEVREVLSSHETALPSLLTEIRTQIRDHSEQVSLISTAIVDDPPVLARTGGVIRQGFSSELDEIRNIGRTGKEWIAAFQQQERERTGIKSLKIGFNKVFGYYIEVTKANLSLVPPEYLRKQTMSNGERFTLPELQEMEQKIAHAEERQSALEEELYTDVIIRLREAVTSLQATSQTIALLDLFSALADAAAENGYTRPVIEESGRLLITDGRHPVVEETLSSVGFVPNDAELDTGGDQIIIITGANMAGKSTYMREVALICIMAQMGSFVPAQRAVVGIVDRVFTRVGAFDDLASGQSTFMVEMVELANILNNVTEKSLVILDEIGRGTSTLDGYSIARAVLEFLHGTGKRGPRTLFATHFHEIVEVETDLKRVKNCHFAVKETGSDVVFLRKLIPGATDRSYGIHVARLAGIPGKVLQRAGEVLEKERNRAPASEGKRAPRYTQMLLLDAPESGCVTESPALIELKNLDPDSMTPRDALAKIYELQKKV
ncbi:DNA mismatch repair protein MutS [Methanogenium organophilum]|uniref:DNA mismatch repair protein MutS n=1 Tax=Methanogenium organophilum TaxID=2199 RepID=A0A9X9S2L6_METOG|nr:DNA mismatch repair protein MutS [Methanogenium organophilum]WAI00704.1 DNA mismatch repair protein MutS [Methanogenium organophilum]